MGFTPLAGLVMNTRPGTLDPGLLLWLLEHGRVPVSELADVLEHHSGLRGLSGTSGDLRDVLAGVAAGDDACALALDVYLHRLCREIAAMTAATRGLDVLVMTGGVDGHVLLVRVRVADRLAHLGLDVEPALNDTTTRDGDISRAGAAVRTLVITSREDLEMARQVASVLQLTTATDTPAAR
jgi:acetate kinase